MPLCRKVTGGGKRAKLEDGTAKATDRPRRSSGRTTTSNATPKTTTPVQGRCNGVLKPDVTFFGEKLSPRVGSALKEDRVKCDCLVVVGTSLSVAPMSGVMAYMDGAKKVCVNREWVGKAKGWEWDWGFLGDIDDVVGGGGRVERGGGGGGGRGKGEQKGEEGGMEEAKCDYCNEPAGGREGGWRCNVCFDFDRWMK